MKRRYGRLAAGTLVLAAAATVGVTGPAQAVDRNCYGGEFCVFRATNYNQAYEMYRFTGADDAWWWGQSAISNDDSSWYSKWSVTVRVYDYDSYGGPVTVCLKSYTGWTSNSYANDRGGSHKWNGVSSC